MGYVTEKITLVFMAVANGEKLVCREVCRKFTWKMQGNTFVADVFLLRLGGCDMVLGVELLAILGDITWNFQDFMMRFTKEEHDYALQGTKELKQKELKVNAFEKLIQKSFYSTVPVTRYQMFTHICTRYAARDFTITYGRQCKED